MSDFSTTDPFSQVYEALWTELESHTAFTDLVRLKNRIKYNRTLPDDPRKDTAQDRDFPECEIVPTTCAIALGATSDCHSIEQVYEIRVATMDVRLTQDILPVKWALTKALADAYDVLTTLDFVNAVRIEGEDSTLDDEEATRGTSGWSLTMVVAVSMFIDIDCFIDPYIYAATSGNTRLSGFNFILPQGGGTAQQLVASAWHEVVATGWTDTAISLTVALSASADYVRVQNNGNNISNWKAL